MPRLKIISDTKYMPWPWGREPLILESNFKIWNGFRLEQHSSRQDLPYLDNVIWPELQIAFFTRGRLWLCYQDGLRKHQHHVLPGSLFISPRNYEAIRIESSGTFECILVQIDGPLVRQLMPEILNLDINTISPQQNIADQNIAFLLAAMRNEILAGCPGGRLYSESLSLALGCYLTSRFASRKPNFLVDERKLSKQQRDRLVEFIRDNLGAKLTLTELANVVHLSPRHLFRLFQHTFGESPHCYVSRARLQQAKCMLLERKTSIGEIVFSLGFGSQSHFTQTFRKWTGVTPRNYQKQQATGAR